jgi:parallel beta-helix repeat protein
VRLAACTFLLAVGAASQAQTTVVYSRTIGEELRLDLHLPVRGAELSPVILITEAWDVQPLLQHGFAVAEVRPRAGDLKAQVHAAKAAVRWLRANARVHSLNANAIGVSGAMVAAALAVTGGVAEFEGALGNEAFSSRVQAAAFGPIDGALEKYASIDDPPVLLTGEQSRLATSLTAARLDVAEGEDVLAFFAAHLKPAALPPGPTARPPVWLDPDKSEPAGTKYRTFASKAAGGQVSYLVYLPPDYASSTQRYPVIYWLHNNSGNQRSGAPFVAHYDRAIRSGAAPAAIIVLVNGTVGSQFADWSDGSRRAETVLVRELIPHIDATYRTIATRAARAVEGFSMGGTAAVRLAFKFPELFGAVAVDAGGLPAEDLYRSELDSLRPIWEDIQAFRAADPITLAERNASRLRGRTLIRHAAGDADPFFDNNFRLHRLLERLALDHDFVVVPRARHSIQEFYSILGTEGAVEFYRRAFAPNRTFNPLEQTPRIWVVNQRHPRASDDASGTPAAPFRTISRAAELAQYGDTVLVHEGVYRERVAPARGGEQGKPITYVAARNEQVVVKGSEVLNPNWGPFFSQPDVFESQLDPKLFGGYNPFLLRFTDQKQPARPHEGPRFPRTLGQLFVDGEPFRETETLDDLMIAPRTWMVSPQGDALYVHFDHVVRPPDLRTVEISVRGSVFAPYVRGLGYIHVNGFTVEHSAMGAVSTGGGHHWVLENNTIRHAKTIGVDLGSESPHAEGNVGNHVVRKNTVSDNGLCGIAGSGNKGTRIVSNLVERNNALGFKEGQGAIDVLFSAGGLIEGNIVRDNDAYGIRLSSSRDNSRVARNVILNNLTAGVFVEMGEELLTIDNNVIANTRGGDGISIQASGVTVAHNLIYGNAEFGVYMQAGRQRNRILNNIIGSNRTSEISGNVSDFNLILKLGRTTVRSRVPNVELDLDDAAAKLRCPAVAGIDEDFYRAPMGRSLVAPGPFQKLAPGLNVFTLP